MSVKAIVSYLENKRTKCVVTDVDDELTLIKFSVNKKNADNFITKQIKVGKPVYFFLCYHKKNKNKIALRIPNVLILTEKISKLKALKYIAKQEIYGVKFTMKKRKSSFSLTASLEMLLPNRSSFKKIIKTAMSHLVAACIDVTNEVID